MKLSSGLVGVTLGASFAVASALPLGAAPLSMPQPAAAQNDLIAVQYEQLDKNPTPMPTPSRSTAPRVGSAPTDIQMRGDIAYYNGHRGYRVKRKGYVEHEGWWFPASAFNDRATTSSIKKRHQTSGNM
jgi:hypothetical protein